MKRIALLCFAVLALVTAHTAFGATEVVITSPAAGAHSLSGVVQATVVASATYGVYSVQLEVDGVAVGAPVLKPVSQYTYVIPWNTAGLAYGNHTLVAKATDWSLPFGGPVTASAPVVVDVGPPYPTIAIDAPTNGTFVRGTTQLRATATTSVSPAHVQFYVDGVPVTTSAAAPWTASWTTGADGRRAVSAIVTDGRGKSATAAATVTVDNTAPAAVMTLPSTQGTYQTSSFTVRAAASDAYGVRSVQFLVDGVANGAPKTQPDAGTLYDWSSTVTVSGISGSQHRVAALVTDNAGNTTTSASVSFYLGASLQPTVTITAPRDWSYGRGVVAVTGAPSGGAAPYTVRLVVDARATTQTATTSPFTIQWDTRAVADGSHTLQLSVTDAQGRAATSAAVHVTVDNTPPSASLTAPASGSTIGATFTASATASDAYGIGSVQFAIDGVATGPVLTAPDTAGGYSYTAALSGSGLANGAHAVTAVVLDRAGNRTTTAPSYVTVGAAALRVAIASPADWSFARAVMQVATTVTGGTPPYVVKLVLDNAVTTYQASTVPYTIAWPSTTTPDGTHVIQASVTDVSGSQATSAGVHVTVDNTPPTVLLLQPVNGAPLTTPTMQLQAHASDAFGMRSVQFVVDGSPVGSPIAPPSGSYIYTYTLDTSTLAAGAHTIAATGIDAAGNVATTAAVTVRTGVGDYMPVVNYHSINPPDGYSIYDQTPAQADAELAYLKANGYQSVTLAQYRQWLAGGDIGIAKPVLITVDDGLKSELAWDALLQKYGFRAVLFAVTGYADQNTPDGSDPNNLTWAEIQGLAANGRWEIGLHAGRYGHAELSERVRVGTQRYSSSCPYFYSCLSHSAKGVVEKPSALQTAVGNEVAAAQTELRQRVPSADPTAFAAPFNDAGQWTNLYNDPSGAIQAWLPGWFASKFSLVFMQTNPVTYGQASGLVGSLTGFNRQYRFEVHTNTTIEQFAQSLVDPAFAR